MLDLNVEVCAGSMMYNEADMASGEGAEASGTSESSVVNFDDGTGNFAAGDDRDSVNSTSDLKFHVFGKSTADGVPDDDDNDVPPDFVTWQLFPVKGDSGGGGGGGGDREGGSSCQAEFRVESFETQWLNLSVSSSASAALDHTEMSFPAPLPPPAQQVKRSRRGPRSRSSQYRGVTFYRRTGRWESHIWDCGKQVYLGGFDTAYAAARAYDRAAIKFRGIDADINFTISDYDEDMKQMKKLSKEEFVQTLRRQINGFPRGSSRYRRMALQQYGQWEAQTNQCHGIKPYHSGREAASNYEPIQISNGEHGHNLDLNLGMSVSADCPRGSKNVAQGDSNSHFYLPADGSRTMLGNPYLLPYGQAICSQMLPSSQSAMWPGATGVAAIPVQERTEDRQLDTVPSSRLSSQAWNTQGGGNQVVPLFPSAASSSRFSF